MKKITLLVSVLMSMTAIGQVITVAETSFEEATTSNSNYTDLGDATLAHALITNVDEPDVNFIATGAEIGFLSNYVPYDSPGSGLTDGDFVGVTAFDGIVGAYTDGVQGFSFSDTDGTMITTFDVVDFAGYTNATVSIDYFINATGYEGDGTLNESGSDLFRIYLLDITNNTEIDILNTVGSDINDLSIEGAWLTGTASIPDGAQVQLVVEARVNSGSETMVIDNVVFTAEETVVVLPQLIISEIFSGQSGDDLTADWFEIENTGATPYVQSVDGDLYYDDESADETTADIITGVSQILPGQTAIVLITSDIADVDAFTAVWGSVIDLSGVAIGMSDGAGLGAGGDAVNIWLGDPTASTPLVTGAYPDTDANDGQSYDVTLNAFSVEANANGAVTTNAFGGDGSVPNIGSPGNGLPINTIEIQFDGAFTSVSEDGLSVEITLLISDAPLTNTTVEVLLMDGGTGAANSDFTYAATPTVMFPAGSDSPQTLVIPILDNNEDGSDVFFVLGLGNVSNGETGIQDTYVVYILDDDTVVPAEDTTQLNASYLPSYLVSDGGTAEISAFDPLTETLFVVNDTAIEVLDFSDPTNIVNIATADITGVGASAQSVAVSNGILAIAIANFDETQPGFVAFSDTAGNEEPVIVQVGALPDMLTFTPDGTKLLVANEGQPNSDYSIDPEGTVSIIDVTGGLLSITQDDVTNVNFNAYDGMEAQLNADGIRVYGPNATASQDFEPEYIAVSANGEKAYVVLQENNAYAIIDIATATVTDVISFGLKDHSLPENSLDTSDESDFVFNASWPIKGMYMPDAITLYSVAGVDYIVTANEGDAREYDAFEEEAKIDDDTYVLDPTVFSDINVLEFATNIGEIAVSSASGDLDNDGDFDEIHVFGGRSFSIFEATTGVLVYDSANDFEVITAADPVYGAIFNASNSNNNLKNRSDNKGPEPEGVIVQQIDGQQYAFILLERVGGVMIYNVTDPAAPVFLQYLNNRNTEEGGDESGDLGPEGILYISPEDNSLSKGLIVISNEVSATLSVIELNADVLGLDEVYTTPSVFTMHPNPASNTVYFSKHGSYTIYDTTGRVILSTPEVASIDVSTLKTGTYIVTNADGNNQKLIIK